MFGLVSTEELDPEAGKSCSVLFFSLSGDCRQLEPHKMGMRETRKGFRRVLCLLWWYFQGVWALYLEGPRL